MSEMRVGVYIDGYNLYYGGRRMIGREAGWKWLDLRALATRLVAEQRAWTGARIERIVYCTARVHQGLNPDGHHEQDAYLKALISHGSIDHIEFGKYVVGVRPRPLAVKGRRPGDTPCIVTSDWPVMVQSSLGTPQPDALFMVSTLHQEEKGTDVNVATHLVTGVLSGSVDAAVVVTNDSDLSLPVRVARDRVPVGLVNPQGGYIAGDLRGQPEDGAGRHWWRTLSAEDLRAHQLPDPVGRYHKPEPW